MSEGAGIEIPFKVDIESPEDLINLLEDPAVRGAFDANDNVQIITYGDIKDILDQINDPAINSLLENKDYRGLSREQEDVLINAIKEKYPEVYDMFFDGVEGHRLMFARRDLIISMYNPEGGMVGFGEDGHVFMRMGNEGFDAKSFYNFAEKFDETSYFKLGESQITDPPNNSLEWNAIVIMHELEHFAGDAQEGLVEQAEAIRELCGGSYRQASIVITQMREVEADIGAFKALDGQISQEVKDYFIAGRLLIQTAEQLEKIALGWAVDREYDGEGWTNIAAGHDTGFHLAHYDEVGEVPNFIEVNASVNNFYYKFMDHYLEALEDELEAKGVEIPKTMVGGANPPPLDVAMGHLQKCMMSDPPVFTPDEMQIAQTLFNHMTETLGIEPVQSLDGPIADVEEYYKYMHELYGDWPEGPAPEDAPEQQKVVPGANSALNPVGS